MLKIQVKMPKTEMTKKDQFCFVLLKAKERGFYPERVLFDS